MRIFSCQHRYANTDSLCSNDLTQHVIGVGTLWQYKGIVSQSGSVYTYLGQSAIGVWKNDWQCTSDRPPIESDGGGGTAGSHWDEACMLNEVIADVCFLVHLGLLIFAQLPHSIYNATMFKHAQFLASDIIISPSLWILCSL